MRIAIAGGTGTVGSVLTGLAREAGHEVLVLSRASGVDLSRGEAPDLTGVDAVIDASGTQTTSAKQSRAFFGAVTDSLLAAAEAGGARHYVALSIVGAARAPYGYYAGKAEQERIVAASKLPWTIVRATQFFEFADQVAVHAGPLTLIPTMRSRPLAASAVARRLLEVVESEPLGRAIDIAGPEELRIAEMARRVREARGEHGRVIELPLPGGFGRALRNGGVLPGADAETLGPSLDEWIAALPK